MGSEDQGWAKAKAISFWKSNLAMEIFDALLHLGLEGGFTKSVRGASKIEPPTIPPLN